MRKKSLLLLLLTVVLAIMLAPRLASSQDIPVVGTQPLPCTAPVGTNFDVNITVADVEDLYGWILNVTFNPTVLEVVEMVEGPFLLDFADSLGIYTWPLGPLFGDGWVQMSDTLFSFDPIPDGADGDGVLATITFEVLTYGTSPLHFLDQTDLTTNVGGLPVPIEPIDMIDGYFRLLLGDINSDGIVAVKDLRILGKAYGTALGQPSYNPDADLNKDDAVNHADLTIFSNNYGKT